MKKTALSLAVASSLFSLGAAAEATGVNTQVDDVIVVTASRTTQEKFDVLASVDVFDRADIERIQPESVADLLSRVAGISTTVSGGRANQTSLFVRGGNSDHLLILVNGVRVGSATLGTKDLSAIALNLIDRVEIVKGPRAALWGADAIGGVIQIFTRQLGHGEAQIGATLGHDNFQQAYATVGLGNESHNYTLTVSGERANGFDVQPGSESDADGYNHRGISLAGGSKFSETYQLNISGQFETGNTQFDSSFGGNESDHNNHSLLFNNQFSLENGQLDINYANSRDHGETFGNNATPTLFETKREQINALTQLAVSQDTELLLGVDFLSERVNSTTEFQESTRETYAAFATGRHQLGKVKLEASVRHDEIVDIDSETTFNLSAGYQLSQQWLVALNHGTAFKAPSFNELYFPLQFGFIGNPNLVSEHARNTELLTRYNSPNYSVEVTLYNTDFTNLIGSGSTADGTSTTVNINEVEIQGIELTAEAQLFGADHRLTLNHVDAEDQSNQQQLTNRPYFTANYAINFSFDRLNLGADIQHKGGNASGFSRTDLSAYTLFNLTANYQVNDDLRVNAKVSNLGDKNYQSNANFNADGRGFRVGVDYRF